MDFCISYQTVLWNFKNSSKNRTHSHLHDNSHPDTIPSSPIHLSKPTNLQRSSRKKTWELFRNLKIKKFFPSVKRWKYDGKMESVSLAFMTWFSFLFKICIKHEMQKLGVPSDLNSSSAIKSFLRLFILVSNERTRLWSASWQQWGDLFMHFREHLALFIIIRVQQTSSLLHSVLRGYLFEKISSETTRDKGMRVMIRCKSTRKMLWLRDADMKVIVSCCSLRHLWWNGRENAISPQGKVKSRGLENGWRVKSVRRVC